MEVEGELRGVLSVARMGEQGEQRERGAYPVKLMKEKWCWWSLWRMVDAPAAYTRGQPCFSSRPCLCWQCCRCWSRPPARGWRGRSAPEPPTSSQRRQT